MTLLPKHLTRARWMATTWVLLMIGAGLLGLLLAFVSLFR